MTVSVSWTNLTEDLHGYRWIWVLNSLVLCSCEWTASVSQRPDMLSHLLAPKAVSCATIPGRSATPSSLFKWDVRGSFDVMPQGSATMPSTSEYSHRHARLTTHMPQLQARVMFQYHLHITAATAATSTTSTGVVSDSTEPPTTTCISSTRLHPWEQRRCGPSRVQCAHMIVL